jgi:hypothetical protein
LTLSHEAVASIAIETREPAGTHRHSVTRRGFLGIAAAAAAGIAITRWDPLAPSDSTTKRWSDPQAWGGRSPSQDQVVRISRSILVDVDANVAGIVVEPGADLVFDPDRSVTVRSTGNVIVEGRLRMRPSSAGRTHRLVFANVNESIFQGGGMEPLDTDVGLWVMDRGRLDVRGAGKRAWSRAAGDIDAGDRTIVLQRDPVGWRVGDEIVITPTLPPTTANFSTAYDEARIRGISGRTIRLSKTTRFAHPKPQPGSKFGAEVLNLTRNVQIEGTPSGRSHVFVHGSEPQRVKNAAIRHMGPRQRGSDDFPTILVPGRYGLHIHMCRNGSRGSDVSGVVIRDTGSHAFVAHLSHGVTFKDCISHDTWDEPYWWDPPSEEGGHPDSFSNDVVYKGCVASSVRFDPESRGYRLSAFWLGTSTERNSDKCIDCVAVGVRGASQASGYHWPEDNEGIWVMDGCVAHNNSHNGIFTWQNTDKEHVISDFTAYHNGDSGIEHGAYTNPYLYRDSILYANGVAGVTDHARSSPGGRLRYQRITVDGAGISAYGFREGEINFPGSSPAIVCSPTIRNVEVEFDERSENSRTFEVRENC